MSVFRNKYFRFVLFLIVLGFAVYIPLGLVVAKNAEVDNHKPSDVILVLGAGVYVDGMFNSCLRARLEQAAHLYNSGIAPKILVSGGDDNGNRVNEAEAMKDKLLLLGIPEEDILLEKAATSTYENLLLSQKIMNDHGLKTSVIVTEPFHITRSSLVAKKLGYMYTVSPAKESPCWVENKYFSRYFLKEPVAILQYRLTGKL